LEISFKIVAEIGASNVYQGLLSLGYLCKVVWNVMDGVLVKHCEGGVGVKLIYLVQDKDKWLAASSTVMNLRVPKHSEKLLTN
jgi:hypothetical protein